MKYAYARILRLSQRVLTTIVVGVNSCCCCCCCSCFLLFVCFVMCVVWVGVVVVPYSKSLETPSVFFLQETLRNRYACRYETVTTTKAIAIKSIKRGSDEQIQLQ